MPNPEVSLIIRGAVLIDGTGAPPDTPGLVALAGDRIAYAGPAAAAPVFAAAQSIDLPGATLLPGLIDMHVHATYYWQEPQPAREEPEEPRVWSPAAVALLAARNLRWALESGVTTARDAGAVDGIIFDVRQALREGHIPGPHLYAAGRIIVPSGGHLHRLPGLTNQADGPYGFRRAVREEMAAGADCIKVANDGADLTQEELQAAVDEAHRLGLKVACHTADPPSERMAVAAGVDTFEHGCPTPADIDLAVERGVTWVPTLNISQAYLARCERLRTHPDPEVAARARLEYDGMARHLERKQASVEYALRAGLRLAAGTDSWLEGVPFAALAAELCRLVEYGCTPLQAILAGTSWAARALGYGDIGALEPGKCADVVAVDGNPLDDVRALGRVILVVRGGQVVRQAAPALAQCARPPGHPGPAPAG